MTDFPKRDVTVTLTGEQWVAFLARHTQTSLSAKGKKLAAEATRSICNQLTAASHADAAKEVQS